MTTKIVLGTRQKTDKYVTDIDNPARDQLMKCVKPVTENDGSCSCFIRGVNIEPQVYLLRKVIGGLAQIIAAKWTGVTTVRLLQNIHQKEI